MNDDAVQINILHSPSSPLLSDKASNFIILHIQAIRHNVWLAKWILYTRISDCYLRQYHINKYAYIHLIDINLIRTQRRRKKWNWKKSLTMMSHVADIVDILGNIYEYILMDIMIRPIYLYYSIYWCMRFHFDDIVIFY